MKEANKKQTKRKVYNNDYENTSDKILKEKETKKRTETKNQKRKSEVSRLFLVCFHCPVK
jgi:hypothetical protein